MTDNGGAMTADETTQGLARLGIVHELTLPHSPYQNAKQERFWANSKGGWSRCSRTSRASRSRDSTRSRKRGSSTSTTASITRRSRRRRCDVFSTARTSADRVRAEALRQAFCAQERRTQRKSDGTISLEGQRFELPSRYRHLDHVMLRYASWDLSWVHLVDDRTGTVLCRLYPLDKAANADGMRRTLEPLTTTIAAVPSPELPPLLAKLVAAQAQTGLPPAYLLKNERASTCTDEPALRESPAIDAANDDGGAS